MSAHIQRPRILLITYGDKSARDSFMGSAVRKLEALAHEGHLQLVEANSFQDSAVLFDAVRKVHGIITISVGSDVFLADLSRQSKPMVVLDHEPIGGNADSVSFDNIGAAQQLGKKIAALGHTDVMYVSRFYFDGKAAQGADPYVETTPSSDRRNGLASAFAGTNVTFWGVFPWFSTGGGATRDAKTDARMRLARTLKQIGKTPDCMVAVDYSVSVEMKDLFAEQNLNVPTDVSLADFQIFPPYEPGERQPISHMRLDFGKLAEEGWRVLSERLRGGCELPPRRVRLKCSFVDEGTLLQRNRR